MSRTKSAKKALRGSLRKRAQNLERSITIDRLTRVLKKPGEGKNEVWQKLQQAIDKAAGRHTLHKNTAARLKSRLSRLLTANVKAQMSNVKQKTNIKKTDKNRPSTTKQVRSKSVKSK